MGVQDERFYKILSGAGANLCPYLGDQLTSRDGIASVTSQAQNAFSFYKVGFETPMRLHLNYQGLWKVFGQSACQLALSYR